MMRGDPSILCSILHRVTDRLDRVTAMSPVTLVRRPVEVEPFWPWDKALADSGSPTHRLDRSFSQ